MMFPRYSLYSSAQTGISETGSLWTPCRPSRPVWGEFHTYRTDPRVFVVLLIGADRYNLGGARRCPSSTTGQARSQGAVR